MQRTTTITIVAVATITAAAAGWFWALRPLGFASYLTSTRASDADIIRHYWPHRLVEPEWVSATPDGLLNWHFTETVARLSVVAVLWSILESSRSARRQASVGSKRDRGDLLDCWTKPF